MILCPSCKQNLQTTKLQCHHCDMEFSGDFKLPRLARLPSETQRLIEQFVLCGGNLKIMAEQLEVSYPTLRKKVDDIIEQMKQLQHADIEQQNKILDDIEHGRISSHKGIRMIKEMNGEL